MVEMRVGIDGLVNAVTAPPEGSQFYFYSLADVAGVAAGNNFLSVFNPVGSGKVLVFYNSQTAAWSTAGTSVAVSMNIHRTTAASAGSLVAASAVPRFVTSQSDPVAQVRIGNPTVTKTGSTLFGTPPAISAAGIGSPSAGGAGPTPAGAGFVCVPGEGVVASTTSGSANQLWNLNFVWAEM